MPRRVWRQESEVAGVEFKDDTVCGAVLSAGKPLLPTCGVSVTDTSFRASAPDWPALLSSLVSLHILVLARGCPPLQKGHFGCGACSLDLPWTAKQPLLGSNEGRR